MSLPAWLASLLGLFAKPPTGPSTKPLAQVIGDQEFASVEDVLAALAGWGVPWAGTADDMATLLQVGFDMVERGVIVPGATENPDGGKHRK